MNRPEGSGLAGMVFPSVAPRHIVSSVVESPVTTRTSQESDQVKFLMDNSVLENKLAEKDRTRSHSPLRHSHSPWQVHSLE